jgi:hypothetical protein
MTARNPSEPAESRWVLVAIVIVFALCSAILAAIAVLLVPFRIGGYLIPLGPLLAGATTALPPIVLRPLRAPLAAWAVPLIAWVLVAFTLATNRPERDVLLPGGGADAITGYAVLGLGIIAGFVSMAREAAKAD